MHYKAMSKHIEIFLYELFKEILTAVLRTACYYIDMLHKDVCCCDTLIPREEGWLAMQYLLLENYCLKYGAFDSQLGFFAWFLSRCSRGLYLKFIALSGTQFSLDCLCTKVARTEAWTASCYQPMRFSWTDAFSQVLEYWSVFWFCYASSLGIISGWSLF